MTDKPGRGDRCGQSIAVVDALPPVVTECECQRVGQFPGTGRAKSVGAVRHTERLQQLEERIKN
jgi:hypothetical protein